MLNAVQEMVLEEFAGIAGPASERGGSPDWIFGGDASNLVEQMRILGALNEAPAGDQGNPHSHADSGKNQQPTAAETAFSVASTVFKSGLGMAPLVSGLIGLFSGGEKPTPPPLLKYAMPPSIAFEAAETRSGISFADYGQAGMPRAAEFPLSSWPENAGATSAATPQVVVNVQAMDARSLLDRSHEIAAAVRDAMLNLNSINDVVNDL